MFDETTQYEGDKQSIDVLDVNVLKEMTEEINNSKEIRGSIKLNEPMSKHTSWRVGGCAERYFQPVDVDDLCSFLSQLSEDEPLFWLGLGSNTLVRDGGIKGTVIAHSGLLNELHIYDGNSMRVGAGVACAKVARMSAKSGLTGGEFLAGIPGTMGGALAMNAGAFGGETWDIVERVETVNRQGKKQIREVAEFETAYRSVSMPEGEWFISAELNLKTSPDGKGLERIQALLNQRTESQPTGKASGGSVFRNPENDFAARLIEASGLKGETIGGAVVSEKHANFIINEGQASASDIESLINLVKEKVKLDHDIDLIPEVRIVGEEA